MNTQGYNMLKGALGGRAGSYPNMQSNIKSLGQGLTGGVIGGAVRGVGKAFNVGNKNPKYLGTRGASRPNPNYKPMNKAKKSKKVKNKVMSKKHKTKSVMKSAKQGDRLKELLQELLSNVNPMPQEAKAQQAGVTSGLDDPLEPTFGGWQGNEPLWRDPLPQGGYGNAIRRDYPNATRYQPNSPTYDPQTVAIQSRSQYDNVDIPTMTNDMKDQYAATRKRQGGGSKSWQFDSTGRPVIVTPLNRGRLYYTDTGERRFDAPPDKAAYFNRLLSR